MFLFAPWNNERHIIDHSHLAWAYPEKPIPEAVTENSKGYLLVNNDPIIWSMLNAIQEQQREFQ